MKKRFLFIVLFLIQFSVFAEIRTIYVTRHGQRGDLAYRVQFKNVVEDSLMPKGVEQAQRLGQYMEKIGFEGTIYVSPYYRTLQTAFYAQSKMKRHDIILEPRFQEVSGRKKTSDKIEISKKCLTKKEIKKLYPEIKIPKNMKFPWRIVNESQAKTDERISSLLDDLLSETKGDIFLVGHGGSTDSLVRIMNQRGANFGKPKTYNCSLYVFQIDTDTGKVISAKNETFNYLPGDLITDNLAFVLPPAEAKKSISLE